MEGKMSDNINQNENSEETPEERIARFKAILNKKREATGIVAEIKSESMTEVNIEEEQQQPHQPVIMDKYGRLFNPNIHEK